MKIAFHTLGCKVNQYETEAMIRDFRAKGHEIVDEKDMADVYVVNTCTVTAMADKKSRQFVRKMKKQNPDSVVVVAGCYSQVRPDDVAAVEGVDIVTGTASKCEIPSYVDKFMEDGIKQVHVKGFEELDSYEDMGFVSGAENRTRAYIKIQEGCNRFCSYCVIPYARGKIRSRDLSQIVEEARQLIASGYKEIVLTGINTALYGLDEVGGKVPARDYAGELDGIGMYGIEKAIAALNELDGDFRIRLSSLEPAVVSAEYVKRLMKYDKLCHHVHLSAQSGSDSVLEAMNRPYDLQQYMEIVRVLREFDPLYGISTDIIVGFPGEKEADFLDSCALVEKAQFVRTHVFKYSKRPFTKAAQMGGHVAPQIKNERSDRLQTLAKACAKDFAAGNLGQVARVLIEELDADGQVMNGYSDNYIKVYVNLPSGASFADFENTFVDVRLSEVVADGMKGEII
ncbi:MAG: tRNA (N(6)-L-threonylcarbamoyladenosine(37)-C(2))-methylthiotransferase MtaB [Eubacterium sp.]|nr:tRNA (N(6)-L-threonylcarbamoyladenosine(37)-C(2))-methylthiotransferase MtaB [Candidatus Colimonas fimequi]